MFGRWKSKYKSLFAAFLGAQKEIESLKVRIAELESVSQTTVSTRLRRDEYERVVKKLPNTMVSGDTTQHEVGFKLGVAHTLTVIDKELVV